MSESSLKKLMYFGIVITSLVLLLGLFRLTCVKFVDKHEFGYKFDHRTGELTKLNGSGYFLRPPFLVSIYTIDLRPMQVCINANNRVLNCKLVQFDTTGFDLFIKWHGVGNYEPSLNKGSLSDILMSYAYDPDRKNVPFLNVKKELRNDDDIIKTNNNIDSTISH